VLCRAKTVVVETTGGCPYHYLDIGYVLTIDDN